MSCATFDYVCDARATDWLLHQLDENHELVWDNGVAPETCLDFDAPHMSTRTALALWSGGLLFFATVFGVVSLTDPESKRVAVPRSVTLPETAIDPRSIYAGDAEAAADGSKDADEEEEEEEEE